MFAVKPCDHPMVTKRRIVEGETFGFPHPFRWPGRSKRSRNAGGDSARRWSAWKIGYFAFMAALLLLVVLAMVWIGAYLLWP
jgi:hypothetical protein